MTTKSPQEAGSEGLVELLNTASQCLAERGLDDLSDGIDEAIAALQTAQAESLRLAGELEEAREQAASWEEQCCIYERRGDAAEAQLALCREALEEVIGESVFNQLRYAEDTDTDYFLRCFKAIKDHASAVLSKLDEGGFGASSATVDPKAGLAASRGADIP